MVCKATVLKNNIERCEARILLSTAIKVTLPNKEVVHGTSVDISSLGAKIKLPRHFHYAVGEKIILAFPILGSKLKLKQLNQGYTYQVLKIDAHPTQENINLLHVKIDADSASMHTSIKKLSFVSKGKNREEINDQIELIEQEGYERLFWQSIPSLPVILNQQGIKFALINESAQQLWDYWKDGNNQNHLSSLFNPQRCAQYTFNGIQFSQHSLFCFQYPFHKKTLFFSLESNEADSIVLNTFCQTGKKQPSWRVLNFNIMHLDDRDSASPAHTNATKENALTHFAVIEDMTPTPTSLSTNEKTTANINPRLKPYLHTQKNLNTITPLSIVQTSLRKELRYQFKSNVALVDKEKTFEGHSVDISTFGLNILLSSPFTGDLDTSVKIHLNEIQQAFPNEKLTHLIYQITQISSDRKNIKLKLIRKNQQEKTVIFLQKLIEKNTQTLQIDSQKMPPKTLITQAKKQYIRQHANSFYFLRHGENSVVLTVFVPSPKQKSFLAALKEPTKPDFYSLEKILSSHLIYQTYKIEKVNRVEQVVFEDFFFWIEKPNNKPSRVVIRPIDEFKHHEAKKFFVQHAQKTGEFYAVRNTLRVIKHAHEALDNEKMNSLLLKSQKNARRLEEEFSHLKYFGTLTDITEDTLRQLNIS